MNKLLGRNPIPVFSDDEKKFLLNLKTAKDKWKNTLTLGLAKRYNVNYKKEKLSIKEQILLFLLKFIKKAFKSPDINININVSKIDLVTFQNSLSSEIQGEYRTLIELIDNELLPSIELRNRIAHGQWVYAFTSKLNAIKEDLTANLKLTASYLLINEHLNILKKKYGLSNTGSRKLKRISNRLYISKELFINDIKNKLNYTEAVKLNKIILKLARIDGENIQTLETKIRIFKDLAELIEKSVVSFDTFNRDFQEKMTKITNNRIMLHNRDYEAYQLKMRARQSK